MKANIIIIGLSKVTANQIKKELTKYKSKNSFELLQFPNAQEALTKIKQNKIQRESYTIYE